MKVRLIRVDGDQEEFSDLIGVEGDVRPTPRGDARQPSLTFFPDGRGDWLVMPLRRQLQKEGKLIVKTRLGNRFTFRML